MGLFLAQWLGKHIGQNTRWAKLTHQVGLLILTQQMGCLVFLSAELIL